MGVQQGTQGFLSAGTFQTDFHGCSLEMVTNQCPSRGQAAEIHHRMELNSEMTRARKDASGYMRKHLGGLGGAPGTLRELVPLWESEQMVLSSGWECTQPFVFENHIEAEGWMQGCLQKLGRWVESSTSSGKGPLFCILYFYSWNKKNQATADHSGPMQHKRP